MSRGGWCVLLFVLFMIICMIAEEYVDKRRRR